MVVKKNMTKKIAVGERYIGGGEPITVQAMTNTDTRDVKATVEQILKLESFGCDIVRIAVPDMEAAEAVKKIKSQIHIPLVADIHYDYRLAIRSMENGIDKIRINPGNLSKQEYLRKIIDTAKERQIPIRIGINSGCVEKNILDKYASVTAEGLVESVLSCVKYFEDYGFDQLVLAVKGSSVPMSIEAYRILSEKTDYPLHIGVTETGVGQDALIKSAIGIGALLADGIGDTLRVSLTGDIEDQVIIGKKILNAMEIRKAGINFVSCPTCGRCQCNASEIAKQVYSRIQNMDKNIKVAVMGCSVNGPGEAKDADIGIAGGINEFVLFKHGNIVKKIPREHAVDALVEEIENL